MCDFLHPVDFSNQPWFPQNLYTQMRKNSHVSIFTPFSPRRPWRSSKQRGCRRCTLGESASKAAARQAVLTDRITAACFITLHSRLGVERWRNAARYTTRVSYNGL